MTRKCFDCGKVVGLRKLHDATYSLGTGYGVDKRGKAVCYDCCAIRDGKELEALPYGGKTCLYLNEKLHDTVKHITNWSGTLAIPVRYTRQGKHNMAGVRRDVWFSYKGDEYQGTQYGNFSDIVHIRKLKPKGLINVVKVG